MTEVYQFKAALNEHSYQSETYSYTITVSEWSYVDLDVLNFGHLIDLVGATHSGAIYVANKQKFFDKFEIETGENVGLGGGGGGSIYNAKQAAVNP